MTMRLESTPFAGVVVMRADVHRDERGSFARLWSSPELDAAGLGTPIAQTSLARNPRAGTVRGLHYALPPHAEHKYVRCLRGAIFDVLVDLRREEPTFGEHIRFTLREDDGATLRVPPGVAHGYQTLCDDADVFYAMDRAYAPAAARTLFYADATLGITWPLSVTRVSDADLAGRSLAACVAEGGCVENHR